MHDIIEYIENLERELNKINNLEQLHKIILKNNFEITEKDIIFSEVSRHKLLLKKLTLKLFYRAKKNIIIDKKQNKVNLNKILAEQIYSPKLLNILLKNNNILNRNIGNIHPVFLKNVKETDKRFVCKKIFDLCGKQSFDLLFRDFSDENHKEWMTEARHIDMNNFAQNLSNLIRNKVTIDYIGRGHNGNVYKLTIDNCNFIYKCFFPYKYHSHYQHGKNAEPQFAYYATKKEKKRFANFYFGRVCSEYDYDAFIIAEYIEDKTLNPKISTLPLLDFCTYLTIDYSEARRFDNLVQNKIVDFGALIEQYPELKDKQVRYMLKLILKNAGYKHDIRHMQYSWKVNYKNIKNIRNGINKFHNYNDYKKALIFIKKHIKHFPNKLRNDLLKIFELNNNYEYIHEDKLNLADLFNSNIKNVFKKLDYYQLKYNYVDCNEAIEMNGYISVNLFDNISAIINYNSKGVINVRIEKQVGNDFEVLFAANKPDDFANFCINDVQ